MPTTIGAIAVFVGKGVGAAAFAAGAGSLGTAIAIGVGYAATYVALTAALAYASNELLGPKNPETGASGREVTVRSTIEPRKMVYGEALVSGPVVYVNTRAPMNAPAVDTLAELWHVIALAGHECDDWSALHLDERVIPRTDFDANGDVAQGEFMGIVPAVSVYFNPGTDNQGAIPEMVTNFADWTAAHRGRGVCHMATRFQTADIFEELWASGPPQNIQLVLRGKKIYDPRRDPSSTEYRLVGSQVLGDPTTYEWSDNPVLCVADYMTDVRLGMGFDLNRIDWNQIAQQADVCDVMVNTPDGPQKRYTMNGTLHTGAEHRTNLREMLDTFAGRITYTGDKFVILAPSFVGPVNNVSLTEDDIISPLQVSTGIRRQDRFNSVQGVFYDPDNFYKPTEYPDVTIPALRLRDNNEALFANFRYQMIDNVYQAQRTSLQRLRLSDQNTSFVATFTLKALELIVHDNVFISVTDLGWSNKIFQVQEWTLVDAGETLGIQMRLVEDDGVVYEDPEMGDYSVVDASGNVTLPENTVPAPEIATAVGVSGGVRIDWTNSTESQFYNRTRVYCKPLALPAVRVFEGNADSYFQTYSTVTTADYFVAHVNEFGVESAQVPAGNATSIAPSGGGGGSPSAVWNPLAGNVWITNDGITWSTPHTVNETATLFLNGTTTVPLTATIDTANGDITVTDGPPTGPEATNVTVNYNGTNGTSRVDVVVSHISGPSTIGTYGSLTVSGNPGPPK